MAIDRGFLASGEDGGSSYFLDSPSVSSRPRPYTSVGSTKPSNRPYRSKSVSNILDSLHDFHRPFHSPSEPPRSQRQTLRHDGVTDLVDFLKNHAPPRDNFMSIPEDGTDDERRKWLKWAKIPKRSKSAARNPPPIRLPDTAVSGTTTGGHRHIAITIPLDASPMGNRPRSQYPVYSQEESKASVCTPGQVRTVVNDKGVVTVLKTANGGREGPPSSSRFLSRPYTQSGPLPRTPSRGGRAGIQGLFPSPPPPSWGSASVYRGEDDTTRETLAARPSSQGTPSAYPTRGSSKRTLDQNISIDGILSQTANGGMCPARTRSERQPEIEHESTATAEYGWPLRDKKPVRVKSSPTAILLNGRPTKGDEDQGDFGPARPVSSQSRRDRVRDRKQRDMEALRNKRQHEDSEEDVMTKSQPTFSPIRVVINVEPCPTPDEVPPTPSLTESSLPPESEPEDRVSLGMPPDIIKDSAQATPSLSAHNLMRHGSLDRISLLRRREWRAYRGQERTPHEMRAAVQERTRELATSGFGEDMRDNTQALDREILRLYEVYREHRFRDMERRVDRLERNGDVWMRALVPVLDNVHRNMASSQQEGLDERAYMSDDEPASARRRNQEFTSTPLRRARSSHHPRNGEMKRQLDILEEMEGVSCCGSPGNDDVSGLDTIEPLMRELAGAARLRQMKTGSLRHPYGRV